MSPANAHASFIVSTPCTRTLRRPRSTSTTPKRISVRRQRVAATLDTPGKPPIPSTLIDEDDGRDVHTASADVASHEEISSSPLETAQRSEQGGSGRVETSILGRTISIPARWLLYAVPFMWGSFGVAVRFLFAHEPHIDAPVFNTTRLFLSSLVYAPILFAEASTFASERGKPARAASENQNEYAYILGGVELGFYVFLANVAQVLGLESVAAGRAAFLVQCQTVIVPVLSGILGLEVIRRKTWVSSVVAIGGVALLSFDHAGGAASSVRGDALELVSAFFFSTYILRLGAYAARVRSAPLVATKIVVQAVLSAAWASGISLMSQTPPPAPMEALDPTLVSTLPPAPEWTLPAVALNAGVVVWTGIMCSALAGWAQTKGQKLVPASETVVIFATQPLWASALAVLLLGESFGPKGIAGGALIVASTLLATAGDDSPKEKSE